MPRPFGSRAISQRIVLAARNKDNLEKPRRKSDPSGRSHGLRGRPARTTIGKTIIEGTLHHFGRIDALLNIAGAVPQIDLFEMTDAQWGDGIALKLNGARRLTIRLGTL